MSKEFTAYKSEIIKIALTNRSESFEGKYSFDSMVAKLRTKVEFTGDPNKDIVSLDLAITGFINELNASWL